jgi:hypothetical protein
LAVRREVRREVEATVFLPGLQLVEVVVQELSRP